MKCFVCSSEIPQLRINLLRSMQVPLLEMACTRHSNVTRKQGIYTGLPGASRLIICKKVNNDSVRGVFSSAERQVKDLVTADLPERGHPSEVGEVVTADEEEIKVQVSKSQEDVDSDHYDTGEDTE